MVDQTEMENVEFVDEDGNIIEGGKENLTYVNRKGKYVSEKKAKKAMESGAYFDGRELYDRSLKQRLTDAKANKLPLQANPQPADYDKQATDLIKNMKAQFALAHQMEVININSIEDDVSLIPRNVEKPKKTEKLRAKSHHKSRTSDKLSRPPPQVQYVPHQKQDIQYLPPQQIHYSPSKSKSTKNLNKSSSKLLKKEKKPRKRSASQKRQGLKQAPVYAEAPSYQQAPAYPPLHLNPHLNQQNYHAKAPVPQQNHYHTQANNARELEQYKPNRITDGLTDQLLNESVNNLQRQMSKVSLNLGQMSVGKPKFDNSNSSSRIRQIVTENIYMPHYSGITNPQEKLLQAEFVNKSKPAPQQYQMQERQIQQMNAYDMSHTMSNAYDNNYGSRTGSYAHY